MELSEKTTCLKWNTHPVSAKESANHFADLFRGRHISGCLHIKSSASLLALAIGKANCSCGRITKSETICNLIFAGLGFYITFQGMPIVGLAEERS